MNVSLKSPARKRLLLAVTAVVAFAYVAVAALQFVAACLGNRVERASLERAAWLDRGNAEYSNHLGRYYDLVARDPAAALGHYRAAVELNPHSARYWFDLASAYQVLGDISKQTSALEHAIQADSMTPDVAWEAANLYLVQGENEKALREFRVVIANDTSLQDGALQLCWRIDPDVDSILRDVLPPTSDAYASLLTLLEMKEETAGTKKVWDALIQSHQPFEQSTANNYIRYLIQHKEVDEAVLVWQQLTNRFALSAYLPSPANLVVNGNFNFNVLNNGFDWRYEKQSSVGLSFDNGDYHSGRRSLLITFDGPGISDAGIFQFVAVQPSTTYDFTAYYKNGEMEGAGGAHFTIQDMYTQEVYYESEELKEAGFWKSADGEFTSGPECKLVVLHIRRLPAGSPIRGKLWVGDFHLSKKPADAAPH